MISTGAIAAVLHAGTEALAAEGLETGLERLGAALGEAELPKLPENLTEELTEGEMQSVIRWEEERPLTGAALSGEAGAGEILLGGLRRLPRLNSYSSVFSGVARLRAGTLQLAAEEVRVDAFLAESAEEALEKEEISAFFSEKAAEAEQQGRMLDCLRLPEREIREVEVAQYRRGP